MSKQGKIFLCFQVCQAIDKCVLKSSGTERITQPSKIKKFKVDFLGLSCILGCISQKVPLKHLCKCETSINWVGWGLTYRVRDIIYIHDKSTPPYLVTILS